MGFHVCHVHLMSVVLQTHPSPSHPTAVNAIQTRQDVFDAKEGILTQEGYV